MEIIDFEALRKENNLTQTDLAKILGVGQSFLSALERGKKTLSKDKIEILKNKFGDISKYITDQPKLVIEGVTSEDVKRMSVDVFTKKLIEMMNDKLIAPYALVDDQKKEIERLNRYIGRLEAEINDKKKIDSGES